MSDYHKGDRVRVVKVPADDGWPMKVGDTGTVAEEPDCLPYVRVDLDLKRKYVLLLDCEIALLDAAPESR